MLLKECICGETVFHPVDSPKRNGAQYVRCAQCGIVRQFLEMNFQEIGEWYSKSYFSEIYQHDFQHDLQVAQSRLRDYSFSSESGRKIRTLEVGCGHGALSWEISQRFPKNSVQVVVQDVAKSPFLPSSLDLYEEEIGEINFPTDHFDVIFCHDVLEHVLNPVSFLAQLFRICSINGKMFLEVPNFEFSHHWKFIEHLWCLEDFQVKKMIQEVGFEILEQRNPIPSKHLFICRKPSQLRKSFLVPQGVGDALWSLSKIKGMLDYHNILPPVDVYVGAFEPKKNHTLPYVTRIPFAKAEGYVRINKGDSIWKESYYRAGRTFFPNYLGADWYVAYNGQLRMGKALEKIDSEYGVCWDLPMFISSHERKCTQKYQERFGAYVAVHMIEAGPYKRWIGAFPIDSMVEAFRNLIEAGYSVVWYGAEYNSMKGREKISSQLGNKFFDLTGQTKLEETFALLRGAKGVLGFPTGVSMIPALWRVPVVLLWHNYFRKEFWWNCLNPEIHHSFYKAEDVTKTSGKKSASILLEMMS